MNKKIALSLLGILTGVVLGVLVLPYTSIPKTPSILFINPLSPKKQVIGFLPYWLLDRASNDYSKYITTLTYFGLKIGPDGKIVKLINPQEEDPGWYALESGKLDGFFSQSLKHNVKLSLLISNGNIDSINSLMQDPVNHANNFIADIKPILEKYKFSDINIDIEYTSQASSSARTRFTQFIRAIKTHLENNETLTVEISPTDVIEKDLIDPKAIGKIADDVVLMAYDYHSPDSFVTGPVAPLSGAGIISEYDVTAAVEKALLFIPPQKLILGIPLYGYEWESLGPFPRSAVIPNTGVVASNRRIEELLSTCSTCSATLDRTAEEAYTSYFDQGSNTYHIIFYPNENSTVKKINFANQANLSGIALWALGYEGNTILNPLKGYRNL